MFASCCAASSINTTCCRAGRWRGGCTAPRSFIVVPHRGHCSLPFGQPGQRQQQRRRDAQLDFLGAFFVHGRSSKKTGTANAGGPGKSGGRKGEGETPAGWRRHGVRLPSALRASRTLPEMPAQETAGVPAEFLHGATWKQPARRCCTTQQPWSFRQARRSPMSQNGPCAYCNHSCARNATLV